MMLMVAATTAAVMMMMVVVVMAASMIYGDLSNLCRDERFLGCISGGISVICLVNFSHASFDIMKRDIIA